MLNHLVNVHFCSIVILFLFQFSSKVSGHGRLIQPASRSSAWRFGFPTTPNYDDNQLFCGGFTVQWDVNDGKCGICGDPYSGPKPNELPDGKYTKPLIITANYTEGDTITALVQLTANHHGSFDFRLCPATSDKVEVTQECLNSHVLEVLNSVDGSRYKYTVPDDAHRTYEVSVALPRGLTCDRCVFQWTYTAGNNWGRCDNGTSATGCGPQETFRACADVRINSKSNKEDDECDDDDRDEKIEKEISEVDNDIDSSSPKISSTTTTNPKDEIERESVTEKPKLYSGTRRSWTTEATEKESSTKWVREKEPTTPKSIQSVLTPKSVSDVTSNGLLKCIPVGRYRKSSGMERWCLDNCNVGFCPPTHCKCE
ncbi:uncharacterized protein LOC107369157 [Tetranychus urticae]|uniref:Chitin-binding type-4 domain-containing protein n=1 Tax=Tetranychus urticae TaxID=32264 RepID=T1L0I5_TETUR|nr:uncharacterized protein LOC107369157 [Tetranychus urticae]